MGFFINVVTDFEVVLMASLASMYFLSPSSTHKHNHHHSSLVFHVEDLLFSSEASIGHLKLWLVEGLLLVEIVPVSRAVHVSVEVLLCLPGGAVPELAVALVAAGHRVGTLVDLQLRTVLERQRAVTRPPVRLVVDLRAQIAGSRSCRKVVLGLVVRCCVEHGAGAVATAANLHGLVVLRDQLGVETRKGEVG